jgi:hypothetical protein
MYSLYMFIFPFSFLCVLLTMFTDEQLNNSFSSGCVHSAFAVSCSKLSCFVLVCFLAAFFCLFYASAFSLVSARGQPHCTKRPTNPYKKNSLTEWNKNQIDQLILLFESCSSIVDKLR